MPCGGSKAEAPLPEALIQPAVLSDALRRKTQRGLGGTGLLTPGAVGCILGHAMMWEHVAQEARDGNGLRRFVFFGFLIHNFKSGFLYIYRCPY